MSFQVILVVLIAVGLAIRFVMSGYAQKPQQQECTHDLAGTIR